MPSKGIVRAALEAAFAEEGCPICRLMLEREENGLRSLLTESVNDLGMRDRLAASWGLCHRHAWGMATRTDLGGPLATAIIYESMAGRLLAECAVRSQDHRQPRMGRPERLTQILPGCSCLYCVAQARLETHYLTSFVKYCAQGRFAALYERSSGLCLRHLQQAVNLSRSSVRLFLLTVAIDKLKRARVGKNETDDEGRDPLQPIRPRLSLLVGPYPFFPHSHDYYRYAKALGSRASLAGGRYASRCALCSAEREAEKESLMRLLQPNQESQSGADWLCPVHAWQLHALAVEQRRIKECALWSAKLADTLIASLESVLRSERLLAQNASLFARLRPPRAVMPFVPQECAVCKAKDESSAKMSAEIVRAVANGLISNGETTPCLRHLKLVTEMAPPFVGNLLRRKQLEKLLKLQGELGEYIHKAHWNYREEPWGEERDSWRKAVDFFVGAE